MIWLINVSCGLILILPLKHIQRKSIVSPCKYATYNSNLHTFTTIIGQSSNGKLLLLRSIKSFRNLIKHRKVPAHASSRIKNITLLMCVCVCYNTALSQNNYPIPKATGAKESRVAYAFIYSGEQQLLSAGRGRRCSEAIWWRVVGALPREIEY